MLSASWLVSFGINRCVTLSFYVVSDVGVWLVVFWYDEVGTTLVKILWEMIFKHLLLYISVSLIVFACIV